MKNLPIYYYSINMPDQEKPKIELMDKPEYADQIMVDFTMHGNELRKPKEWYPELVYNSGLNQDARIYSAKENNNSYVVDGLGYIMEQKFPVSPETAEKYEQAKTSGRGFKLYVPEKGVKILFDENMKEKIRAANKKAGYDKFGIEDGFYAQLLSFDIIDGNAIIKLLIR